VAEERSYSVTVFGLSFDIFTDMDAIWRNFDTPERLNFNILTMLKVSVPLLQKTSIVYSGLEALTAV
jgi:hypothetical protein